MRPAPLFLHNVSLIDGTGADPRHNVSLELREGRIQRIFSATDLPASPGAPVIDLAGCTLLPGLTDAHVHFALTEPNGAPTQPWAEWAARVSAFISQSLDEGFTTVRDAGALDPAWARVVERGLVRGPRILPSGAFLSQTGGHGDWRPSHADEHPMTPIPGLFSGYTLADGADEVRRAAREQLRRGATQIKVMASGGVASPTDPIDATQFTQDEMRAAVEEADTRGTYVLAHAYHPKSIAHCLDAGIRSIEHGNLLDEESAARMAKAGTFLVPTLITYDVLAEGGQGLGLSSYQVQKLQQVWKAGEEAVRIAKAAGVRIGSGSDLLGPAMAQKARELVIKSRILSPMEAIVSATRTNAELFGMQAEIGTVEEGKLADLTVFDRNPLTEPEAMADAERVRLVLKGGAVVKDMDERFVAESVRA
ncbi:MAG: amidohydrolase family protein [Chloroflexota bacterium]